MREAVREGLEEVAQRDVRRWVLSRGLEEDGRRRVLGGEQRVLQYVQAERASDKREENAVRMLKFQAEQLKELRREITEQQVDLSGARADVTILQSEVRAQSAVRLGAR